MVNVNDLVQRLDRCVGGKLATDVSAAVKELQADLQRADARVVAAEEMNTRLLEQVAELQNQLNVANVVGTENA